MFQTKLANKSIYTANIRRMRLKLAELQESDIETEKIRAKELKKGLDKYVNVNKVVHYQRLLFLSKKIWTELISKHLDNFLASYFNINKTKSLLARNIISQVSKKKLRPISKVITFVWP